MKESFKLSPELQEYILSSMTWLDGSADAQEGVDAMARFLTSAGVFCPSPLIVPSFGTGEFPQAFCRLCAVFGGLYLLNMDSISIRVSPPAATAAATARDRETAADADTPRVCGASIGPCTVTAPRALVPRRVAAEMEHSCVRTPPNAATLYSRASLLIKCDSCEYLDATQAAALISIPAGTCGLAAVCRAYVFSSSTGVCPRGYSALLLFVCRREGQGV